MIKTTKILLEEYKAYKNPRNKVYRLIKQGKLIPISAGLYETDKNIDGKFLAGSIYGPSYLSFDYALSYYGMIPEAVYLFSSATCEKHKTKEYVNFFGKFTYRDVPKSVFSLGVEIKCIDDNCYKIASKEKALCDKLYTISPLKNQKELEKYLFESLRIDEDEFVKLNKEDICIFADKYKNTNIKLLNKYIRRIK